MPLPKLSLILFDWDGFTMITESNRLQDARKKELKKATRSTLSYDGQLHVVEILELSDNRATLEDFDTEWASTHRAEAISDEQAKRQRAKGRTKKGGFLDIWGDPDNQQQAQLPVVHHEEVPSTTKKIKKGSNGRQITVLYEGSADDTDCIAEPRRQPLNMETLSNTEKDVVNMQIQFHDVGHICMGTMTDSVIILEDGELEDMLKTARSKKGTHISTQTNDPTVSAMSTQISLTTETQCTQTNAATEVQYSKTNDPTVSAMSTQTSLTTETQCTQTNAATEVQYSRTNDPTVSAMSTQTSLTTETQCTQTNAATEVQYSKTNDPTVSAMSTQTSLTTETQCTQSNCIERILGIEKKLDEILTLMQTFNRPLNVSDIVNWVSANTPNHTGAGVTIVPVTEAQSLPVITPLASCVSPIIESEELPVERDFTDDYPHISALPPLDPPSSPTVRRPLFSSPIEPQENRRPLTELTSHVNNVQSSQTSAISSQKLVELNCSKDDPLKEINDFNDISDGKYEFRIRRETLARLKSSSCSDGNFLWSVTRKIFRTDELVGKNFFGRKGRDPLSPRRVHALKHAYVDFCGSDYKAFTTAVCSINNGIRSLNR